MNNSISVYNSVVAGNIKKIIDQQGLKQSAVAAKINLTTQMLNDMLNGRRIMKAVDMEAIMKALGVEANDLFKRNN